MTDDNRQMSSKFYLIIGIVISLLAVIGLITLVSGGISLMKGSAVKNNKTDEYKALIAPVIMNDPEPFDDVINADQKELISISIWSLLRGDVDPDSFKSTKAGMLVGIEYVEQEFAKLFGKDVAPLHQTVAAGEGLSFEYSKNDKAYIVPITGITALYSPSIADIKEKGSSVILTVGYLASEDWVLDAGGNMIPPEPVKYMKIYLRQNGDSYYISSIKQTDGLEIVTEKDTSEPVTKPSSTEKTATEATTKKSTKKK